jgi:hypothetical protein
MPDTPVTLTLPLTQAGAQVLLAALGIALATGAVYLMLRLWRRRPRADPAVDLLKALGAALVPVWLILLGGTLWHLWLLFDGQESVLGDTGFGMGAVIAAFLGGPFVIWGTAIKQKTVKYHKEGHITDRISKAVEQLGEEKTVKRDAGEVTVPNIEVRIGGLLSLERIAQDSTQNDKGRDHVRVMEILCAYVRQNAPASEARDFPLPEWEPLPDDATEEARAAHEAWREARFGDTDIPVPGPNAYDWARSLPGPRADIALALQIIGRRSPEQRLVEARWGPTASADAAWVFDTPCPELPEPEDDAPHGTEALDAFTAKLDAWKARIDGYEGYRLDLRGTNLQGADLSGLTLSGSDLTEARMDGADVFEARMEGAELYRAWMTGADLAEARMMGADFEEALIEGADLSLVRMEGAALSGALLDRVLLLAAQFSPATSVSATHLQYAALKKVDLSILDLSQEQIDAAFGDTSVTLPDGLVRPAHWPDWELAANFHDEWRKWQADPAGYTPPPPPGD